MSLSPTYPSPSAMASLAHGNLMSIFNERSPEARMNAMKKYYAQDIVFHEPEATTLGHESISKVAQDLLDKAPGWVFEPFGTVITNHNLIMLAWGFGPPGDAKVNGKDIMLVENGKIKVLYTVIEGQSEVS